MNTTYRTSSLPAQRTARTQPQLYLLGIVALIAALLMCVNCSIARADDADQWDQVAADIQSELETIPASYEAGDITAIQDATRRAYYEHYQVSGLEQQIQHRLGDELNDQFVADLLEIRSLASEENNADAVEMAVQQVIGELLNNVEDLKAAPEVNDQWTRVATSIVELLDQAGQDYASGNYDGAYNNARDAYLAHYEAHGLEKATISYIGQSRVNSLEAMFQDLRQWARDVSVSTDEYNQTVTELSEAIAYDGAQIDQFTSGDTEMGWTGFFAAFLILLREGAEALLVVAAVVTFAMKAGRKDQLVGIVVGVVAAVALSIGLAVLFSILTATATTGLSQELLEGITGFLAVIMLVWVAIWIHNKADAKAWDRYIQKQAGEKVASGGVLALGSVAFLAVLREGSETILFFAPILAGARSSADHLKIWGGVAAAAIVLAVLFILVWKFGVRLPLKQFFTVMSALIAVLAITILGGAIKELQDATLISAHAVSGVPTVSVLGLYPTAETLLAQALLLVVFVIMWIVSRRNKKTPALAASAEN